MGTYPVYLFALADAEAARSTSTPSDGGDIRARGNCARPKKIVAHLRVEHRAERLDVIKIGWGGDGRRPLDAVDTDDVRIMAGWISRAYVTDVRLDVDAPILADAERASA